MRDQRQHDHDRRRPLRGLREQPEAEAQHPEGADLVEHADQQHAGAGRRLLGGVGQPGVHREQRRLDREGDEEADEQPALGVGARCRAARRSREQVRRVPGVGGHDVEPDHRGEHDQPAGRAGRSGTSPRPRRAARRGRSRRSGSTPGSASPRRRRRRGTRRWPRRPPSESASSASAQAKNALALQCRRRRRARTPSSTTGDEDDGEQDQQQAEAVDAEGVVGAERA